jgi:hypothetical protein
LLLVAPCETSQIIVEGASGDDGGVPYIVDLVDEDDVLLDSSTHLKPAVLACVDHANVGGALERASCANELAEEGV